MSKLKKVFFYLSVIGWCLSLIVHLSAVSGFDVESEYPYVFLLHIGIFIVWFPAIISTMRNEEYKESGNLSMSPIPFLKITFGRTPIWLTVIAAVCLIYAFVNFFLAFGMFDFLGSTENTGINDEANTTRGFSGHWLAFYGMAAVMLYPYKKKEQADDGYTKEYK